MQKDEYVDIEDKEVLILPQNHFKDGMWFEKGWVAYRHAYNIYKGLQFVRAGDTKDYAVQALNDAIEADRLGYELSDTYWLQKHLPLKYASKPSAK